jgi:uncharacterized membrane protein
LIIILIVTIKINDQFRSSKSLNTWLTEAASAILSERYSSGNGTGSCIEKNVRGPFLFVWNQRIYYENW